MRNQATLLLMGLCLMKVQGQSYTVQVLNTGVTHGFGAVHFANAATGYAVWQAKPYSGVLKTSDGGATWSTQLLAPNPLRDVYFINADTGYVAGEDGIMKTMDGGGSWANVHGGLFRSVFFTSADTGFAAGAYFNGLGVWKTMDAGATWNMVLEEESDFLHFEHAAHGFVSNAVFPFTHFFRTTDAGASWTPMTIDGLDMGAACFFFTSADTGYVGEWERGIFKTTDGCATWTALDMGSTFYFRAMHFLDADRGFAVGTNGSSVLLQTTDGGQSWSQLFLGQGTGLLTDVHFPEPGVGYVCGSPGTMLKITELPTDVSEAGAMVGPVLYPNPTSGAFCLRSRCEAGTVRITNALGELVVQQRLSGMTAPLTLERNGTYQVEVQCGEQRWRSRLVVCR